MATMHKLQKKRSIVNKNLAHLSFVKEMKEQNGAKEGKGKRRSIQ